MMGWMEWFKQIYWSFRRYRWEALRLFLLSQTLGVTSQIWQEFICHRSFNTYGFLNKNFVLGHSMDDSIEHVYGCTWPIKGGIIRGVKGKKRKEKKTS